jgi:hypothetical protein
MNTNVGDERPSTNRELQDHELDGVTGGLGDIGYGWRTFPRLNAQSRGVWDIITIP